jgi:hypothetical protein
MTTDVESNYAKAKLAALDASHKSLEAIRYGRPEAIPLALEEMRADAECLMAYSTRSEPT